MDRDFEITTGPDGLPTQTFNGKTYKKRINEDKEWFSEFHKKGIEAAKQWHSSPEGKEWHSELGKLSWKGREYKILICQQCGKEYETRHNGISKFCHNNCKAKALRARRKMGREGL